MSAWAKNAVLTALCISSAAAHGATCADRQALNQSASSAGYSPNLFLRLEGNWRKNQDPLLPDYDRRRGDIGLDYSFRELMRSRLNTELTELECLVGSSENSEETLSRWIARARIARLNAEIEQISNHLPEIQRMANVQRERYLGRTVNVIEYDNALARLQRFNKMLADRNQAVLELKDRAGLSSLADGVVGQKNLQEIVQRMNQIRHSLARLNQWDFKASLGRRVAVSSLENKYDANFAGVEFTLNLGAPARIFQSIHASDGETEGIALRVNSLNQELQINQDRLGVLEEAVSRAGQKLVDGDDKIMEIFARWLELKTDNVGIKSELLALNGNNPVTQQPLPVAVTLAPPPLEFISVGEPTYRRTFSSGTPDQVTVQFRLNHATETKRALGSGDIREQLGVMLRQRDQCNLVYAMIRVAEKKIVVQEKHNPGMSTHEECLNSGYSTISPSHSGTLPELKPQKTYQLSASIDKDQMTVSFGNEVVWRGPSPKIIQSGANVGFRSDNLNVEYRLITKRD